MTLKDQVCSLKLAKRLKELGVKHNSAFTVAELGEMLPNFIQDGDKRDCRLTMYKKSKYFTVSYQFLKYENGRIVDSNNWGEFNDEVEADARAKMLIYLIENKLIEMPKGGSK